MRIFCLRHGLTDACENKDKTFNKDVSLNFSGKLQVLKTRDSLHASLRDIRHVRTSPTLRTVESAALFELSVPSIQDPRLYNKKDSNEAYTSELLSLLQELVWDHNDGDVLLCTHGRIIKMLYSIIMYGSFRQDIIDSLSLEYGTMTVFFHGKEEDAFSCEILNNQLFSQSN